MLPPPPRPSIPFKVPLNLPQDKSTVKLTERFDKSLFSQIRGLKPNRQRLQDIRQQLNPNNLARVETSPLPPIIAGQ